MNRRDHTSSQNLSDVSAFLETVKSSTQIFNRESEIFITRAPGRLDVMGGIADYSGSLVLEMPIAEAALVALQKNRTRVLKIISFGAEDNNRANSFEMSLDDFAPDGEPISYHAAQAVFGSDPQKNWAAYIAGAFLVLMREKNFRFEAEGAQILIDSKVPEGKGVSSSAAIEVAAMSGIAAAFEIAVEPRELALLCQKVENLVVGAPCGIMDQMSSVCGAANQLLSLVCQPAELRETVRIPPDLAVWGIDSGIRHSVGAGDYGSVRTGAFMGYRIIAELAGLPVKETEMTGVVQINDSQWNGYLANLTPAEFERNFAAQIPSEITGAEFLARYQGISDSVTRVVPGRNYQVFYPTAHPIYENFRVHRFAELLKMEISESNLQELGALMFQSHESYSACGLGTDETDLLVELVKQSGAPLDGAKITGGGSGGTVAVLGRAEADPEIKKLAQKYEEQTGYQPYIFSGSSIGAAEFGYLKFNL